MEMKCWCKVRRVPPVAVCLILLIVLTSLAQAKELVDMEFKQAPLVDVFQILGELGGYNVLVDPSVSGNVTFALKDLEVDEALDLITRTTGYRYQLVGNTLVIASEARLKQEFESNDFAFVAVKHVGVEAAQRLVNMVVPNVRSYPDAELGLLVLYGPSSDLAVALDIIREYDQTAYVPIEPTVPAVPAEPDADEPDGERIVRRVIPVRYGDGREIAAALAQLWPERDFIWDERIQSVAAYTLEEEWADVQLLVQELDLPTFVIKGILGSTDQSMVLVEYRGETSLVRQGEALYDWTLVTVQDGVAEFRQDGRSIRIGMGR